MHEQVLPWLLIKTKFKTKISCEKTMTLLVNLNEIKTSDLRVIVFLFFFTKLSASGASPKCCGYNTNYKLLEYCP